MTVMDETKVAKKKPIQTDAITDESHAIILISFRDLLIFLKQGTLVCFQRLQTLNSDCWVKLTGGSAVNKFLTTKNNVILYCK